MSVALRLVRVLVTLAVPVVLFAGNVRLLATEAFLQRRESA